MGGRNNVAELVKKGLTATEIARRLGLSRQRIHQIITREGLVSFRRAKIYPHEAKGKCKRCAKPFTFSKLHRRHIKVFCSERCWKIIKYQKVCHKCHEKKDLVKAGKNNLGAQKYVCRPCRSKA